MGVGGKECVVKYKCKFYPELFCLYFNGSFYLWYFYTTFSIEVGTLGEGNAVTMM